jgi:AcrR family transcriptional regulator
MELTSQKPLRRNTPPIVYISNPQDSKPERKRDRTAKQQALMSAAKKLFAQRGYEATTTREIAAHAGCAEGLIHRYFKGKAGLFRALIENRRSQDISRSSNDVPTSGKLQDEMLELAEQEIQHIWGDREFLKVILPRAMNDPNIAKLLLRGSNSRSRSTMIERLRRLPDSSCLPNEQLEACARLVELIGFAFGFLRPILMAQDPNEAKKEGLLLVKNLAARRLPA